MPSVGSSGKSLILSLPVCSLRTFGEIWSCKVTDYNFKSAREETFMTTDVEVTFFKLICTALYSAIVFKFKQTIHFFNVFAWHCVRVSHDIIEYEKFAAPLDSISGKKIT